MNFFHHKIANPAGNSSSWDEWLENYLKTASEAKPECDDDPRGQCRGQEINNDNEEGAHSYQEGESVDGKPDQKEAESNAETVTAEAEATETPEATEEETTEAPEVEAESSEEVKEAHCDKDMGECDEAGAVTEDHGDAGNADVGDAAVEQNINNDPNYQKGESEDPGDVTGENKKEADAKGFKKIACLDRKEKLELFARMSAQKTKSGTPAYPIQYVEAMLGMKFQNLKDDEKAWFKKFWLTMFPDAYVSEMVADR